VTSPRHVRFTPESRHVQRRNRCLLCAITGSALLAQAFVALPTYWRLNPALNFHATAAEEGRSMENPAKETIIIVHGTWAAPTDDQQPDQLCWYQIPAEGQNKPNFVSKLNKALERRGSPARCWAHCKDNSEIFSWTGENAWIDRTRAASSLAAEINKLQADGWKCHVVAHSHGGNVIAEALPAIVPTSDRGYGLSGTITTLGTPFIDIMLPIANQNARWRKIWSIVILLMVLSGSITGYIYNMIAGWYSVGVGIILIIQFILLYLLSLLRQSKWRWQEVKARLLSYGEYELPSRQVGWIEYWKELGQQGLSHPNILCVSSSMDETWQLLHHVRATPNPLAPKSGPIGYLWTARRTYIRRSLQIERIEGVALFADQTGLTKTSVVAIWLGTLLLSIVAVATWAGYLLQDWLQYSILKMIIYTGPVTFLTGAGLYAVLSFGKPFFSAFLAPFRWLGRQGRAIIRMMSYDLGTYVARLRSWSLLQEIVFGLEGYGFQLPKAEMVPSFAPSAIYKPEELPEGTLQRALANREEWVRRNFGEVTKTFSELVVSASDLSSLLKKVETDLSLVHAAYYTDDECIERIADWIAGGEVEGVSSDAVRLAS
jgi:hypothetical protein